MRLLLHTVTAGKGTDVRAVTRELKKKIIFIVLGGMRSVCRKPFLAPGDDRACRELREELQYPPPGHEEAEAEQDKP